MRWLIRGKFKWLRGRRAFTLIEVLVGVGILGIIGTGIVIALDTNSRATRTLDEQVVAANLATEYLEAIRDIPYADTYPNTGGNIDIPFQYSVTINTKCSIDGTAYGACTGADNETLQKIIISVSREGRPVLSACTYRCKR